MGRPLTSAVRGAGAGATASGAMGLVLLGATRAGIVSKVAPEEITEGALDAVGVNAAEAAANAASTMSHFASGAASGALDALVHGRLPVAPVLGGVAFAGLLMVASYEGWVPAVGALPSLRAQTPGGRWTLIAGHAVSGAVLGQLASSTSRDGDDR